MNRTIGKVYALMFAAIIWGILAPSSFAGIIGDPNATVNGTLTVANGANFTGLVTVDGIVLSNFEHRVYGSNSNIRFVPSVSGWEYIQIGDNAADTGARLRIARMLTGNSPLSAMEVYTSFFRVSNPTGFSEMRVEGATTGYRLLGDVGGVNFIQVGSSASDTNAQLKISRFATGNTPIASMEMYADLTHMSGNVGIGTLTPETKLDVNGEATVDVLNIRGADISEKFDISGEIQPGYVVSIDPASAGDLMVSTASYDRKVAGIVSGAGGIRTGVNLSQEGTLANGKHPVAISGRVYCFADATNGVIEPGDLLTTSNIPGHVMKAADTTRSHGAIIGKAMTGLDSGQDLVLVLVNLQ